jgi:hypothetical protein
MLYTFTNKCLPVNNKYPNVDFEIRALKSVTRRILHMVSSLHHNRIVAFKQMPIVGSITEAIHREGYVPGRVEHRQRAVGWLSGAG